MLIFFFFNDTATTEIYTLSLHDALPIYGPRAVIQLELQELGRHGGLAVRRQQRSEEHTSELQSRQYLVCRLLLEKKKNQSLTRDEDLDDEVATDIFHTKVWSIG